MAADVFAAADFSAPEAPKYVGSFAEFTDNNANGVLDKDDNVSVETPDGTVELLFGTDAFNSIAEAVASSVSGDEIVILPGTYNEDLDTTGGQDLTIRVGGNAPGTVTIQGELKMDAGDTIVARVDESASADKLVVADGVSIPGVKLEIEKEIDSVLADVTVIDNQSDSVIVGELVNAQTSITNRLILADTNWSLAAQSDTNNDLSVSNKTPVIVSADLVREVTDTINAGERLQTSGEFQFIAPNYENLMFSYQKITAGPLGQFSLIEVAPEMGLSRWEYQIDNSHFKYLAANTQTTIVYRISIQDTSQRLDDQISVTIVVKGINDAPQANDLQVSVAEDSTLTNVALPFTDPDVGDSHVITLGEIEGTPTVGLVTIDPTTGKFSYDPNGKFDSLQVGETAQDFFTYQVADSAGAEGALRSETRTVTVTIEGKNNAPTASLVEIETDEDNTGTQHDFNYSDVDSENLTFDIVSGPSRGQVINNNDGTFTYIAAGEFNELREGETAEESFVFSVTDEHNETATATVLITIHGVNDAPVANNMQLTVAEDGELTEQTFDIDYVDFAGEGDHTVVIDDSGLDGEVTYLGNGKFSYTPNGKFDHLFDTTAVDTFTYYVEDSHGARSEVATVEITITPVNSAPIAEDVYIEITEDQISDITKLLVNYVDATDEHSFTFSESLGKIIELPDGHIQYDPDGQFDNLFNTDFVEEISYTVKDSGGLESTAKIFVTIKAVDSVPVANDVDIEVSEDSTGIEGQFDFDPVDLGDTSEITLDLEGTHGSVELLDDGKFIYTPNGAFDYLFDSEGLDSFKYTVTDGAGNSSTATVNIRVTPVDSSPIANDVTLEVAEDAESIEGNFDFVEVDEGDDYEISIDLTGTSGNVELLPNGKFSYSPNGQFNHLLNENGEDSFTYTVTDAAGNSATATVTITVLAVDSVPQASPVEMTVAENDGPTAVPFVVDEVDEGDSYDISVDLTGTFGLVEQLEDGTFTYSPNGQFDHLFNSDGTDSFSYTVTDSAGNSTTSTVTITITAVDNAPIAGDTEISIGEDSTGEAFDLPIESVETGDPTTIEIVSVGAGTATINEEGKLVYSPNGQFESLANGATGSDTVVYLVKDSAGNSSQGTVLVNIEGANDAPTVQAGTNEVLDNTTVTGTIDAQDIDEGDTLSYSVTTDGTLGIVTVNPDGTYHYDPNGAFDHLEPGAVATDSFTFTVTDNNGGTASSTVTITVTGSDKSPIATDDQYTTALNTILSIPAVFGLLANDAGFKGAPISIIGIQAGGVSVGVGQALALAYGNIVVQDNGAFTYLPTMNAAGIDEFTYTISDGTRQAQAVAKIAITGPNHAPIAIADYAITAVGQPIIVDVLYNDFDQDGDGLNLERVRGIPVPSGVVGLTTGGGKFEIETDESGYSRVLYTPGTGFSGVDQFSYIVSDGRGGFDGAEVYVEVRGDGSVVTPTTNTPPVARDDNFVIGNNSQLALGVFGNDSDSDAPAQQLTIESITVGSETIPFVAGETFTFEGLGELTFTSTEGATNFNFLPLPSATGVVEFSYTISDGHGGVSTANVSIEINDANHGPEAVDDEYSGVLPGELFEVSAETGVLHNDTDADGDSLSASLLSQPVDAEGQPAGIVSLLQDGSFIYMPTPGFEGEATFTYRATDGSAYTRVASVKLVVSSDTTEAPTPVLTGDEFSVLEGSEPGTVVGKVEVTGLEGRPHSFSIVEEVPFTIGEDGTITIATSALPEQFDYDAIQSYPFTVKLTYGDGDEIEHSVVVMILEDAEPVESSGPRVTNVRVSSTEWTDLFKSYVHHEGEISRDPETGAVVVPESVPDTYGFAIPQGASQSLALPWVNINQIIIEFDQDIADQIKTDNPDQFVMWAEIGEDSNGEPLGTSPGIETVVAAGNTVILNLSGPLMPSQVNFLIVAEKLMNGEGLQLDGDWVNGSTIGSSGDGVSGGDFHFIFNVLPGDVNGDLTVNRLLSAEDGGEGDEEVEALIAASRLIGGMARPTVDTIPAHPIDVAWTTESDVYSPFRDLNGDGKQAISDATKLQNSDGNRLLD